ncbi:hypothetical protein M8J75_003833 [Diaphorina citri]|nr:hypothetical protein M8J75_003833 [Diaphorina citri]
MTFAVQPASTMEFKLMTIIVLQLFCSVICHECGEPEVAFWEKPCGKSDTLTEAFDVSMNAVGSNWEKQIYKGLDEIKRQVRLVKIEYRTFNITSLYSDVHSGMNKDQFLPPTWIPAQGNINSLIATKLTSIKEIVRFIPGIYSDLQKFAVAFEQIRKDETSPDRQYANKERQEALQDLVERLSVLLCNVNSALVMFDMAVPPPIKRSIMAPEERNITDDTFRLMRDFIILVKYREYIKQLGYFLRTGGGSSLKERRKKNFNKERSTESKSNRNGHITSNMISVNSSR